MAKKKTTKKSASQKKQVAFESALEQLRAVVGELENGNLSLSDSLEKYEQGVANLKLCYDALNQAQRKIELLVDLDEDGNTTTRPFDDAATHDEVEEDGELDTEDALEEEDDPNSLF